MKVIDLLNKIAKGEELPNDIILCEQHYTWNAYSEQYEDEDGDSWSEYTFDCRYLNEEVKTFTDYENKKEPTKDIEPCDFNLIEEPFIDEKINRLSFLINDRLLYFERKINEIINKLNEESED